MTQFDDLLNALNGSQPQKPTPPPSLSDLFRATQPKPPAKPNNFVRIARPQPKPFVRIARPRVFVSFDYENDSRYKFLLSAWNKNSRFQFTFQDKTPQEIQSDAVDRVKAVLTKKVKEASYTLVIVGRYATQRHKDATLIGCTNWINYEIQQSNLYKKKIVAVRLDQRFALPNQLNNSNGFLVEGFNQERIMKALADLKPKR